MAPRHIPSGGLSLHAMAKAAPLCLEEFSKKAWNPLSVWQMLFAGVLFFMLALAPKKFSALKARHPKGWGQLGGWTPPPSQNELGLPERVTVPAQKNSSCEDDP